MRFLPFCGFTVIALFSTQATAGEKLVGDGKGITAQVETLLGIKGRSADVETPMAAALSAFAHDVTKVPEAVKSLVDAINSGFDPEPLVTKLRSINTVEEEGGVRKRPADWKLETYVQREALRGYLYARAAEVRKTDGAAARRLVRAAFVLDALEVETNGQVAHLRPKEVHLAEGAGLEEAQFKEIETVCARYEALMNADAELVFRFRNEMFRAMKKNKQGPLPQQMVVSSLKLADEALAKTETVPCKIWILGYMSYYMRDSVSRKDADSLELMQAKLRQWEQSEKDKPIEFWIKQLIREYDHAALGVPISGIHEATI